VKYQASGTRDSNVDINFVLCSCITRSLRVATVGTVGNVSITNWRSIHVDTKKHSVFSEPPAWISWMVAGSAQSFWSCPLVALFSSSSSLF
jgi:hypothetical protein